MYDTKNQAKVQVLTVKLSPSEKEKLQKEAEQHGMNTSEYFRHFLHHSVPNSDKHFARTARPIVRSLQTYLNLLEAGIETEEQKERIVEEVKQLCVLLKS